MNILYSPVTLPYDYNLSLPPSPRLQMDKMSLRDNRLKLGTP